MPEPRNKTCKIVGVTVVHEDFYFGLLTSSLMNGIVIRVLYEYKQYSLVVCTSLWF
jgi:hypothetical protein